MAMNDIDPDEKVRLIGGGDKKLRTYVLEVLARPAAARRSAAALRDQGKTPSILTIKEFEELAKRDDFKRGSAESHHELAKGI
jgi:hypothetical protein